jgi:hypothetical protein
VRRDKATEELRKQVAELIRRENRYPRISGEGSVVFANDRPKEKAILPEAVPNDATVTPDATPSES